jgi:hypothetical protein
VFFSILCGYFEGKLLDYENQGPAELDRIDSFFSDLI